ncbi:branched-chain amino acid ABC transporter permease [Nocardioides allogilvus]|uniref:branched-chain amino acid ABC transporter permease n=1 Tax=Nocardioides allogilvus TaxID=2072017 RepID=UPI000D315D5F|nr:branched-chain amino acid ABC transporter permease [Nocardioides allogilvus]
MRRAIPVLAGLVLLVALLALADMSLNSYYLRILGLMGIYIVLTVSLNLPNGFTGDFSLGHAAFMAVGGYCAAVLTMPLVSKELLLTELPTWLQETVVPFPIATVAGGLLAALVALPVGLVVLRLRGHYLAVATIGLLIVVQGIATNWDSVTRGARGLSGLQPHTTLWWSFGWAVVTIFVVWRMAYSPFGRAMVSIRDDPLAAACRGVRVFRTRLVAFIVSAFFAGVGGSLLAHQITAVTPSTYSFDVTFLVIIMLVVGGMGSVTGSVIGAVIMTVVPVLLRDLERELDMVGTAQLVIAGALIAFMIFRRQGLMGTREFRLAGRFGPKASSPSPAPDQSQTPTSS